MVRELTDDKTLEKQRRKAIQIEHARSASQGAKQLKIADKICNIRDIAERPSSNWPVQRRREYLQWAKQVVDGCRGVNHDLDAAFDDALAHASHLVEADGMTNQHLVPLPPEKIVPMPELFWHPSTLHGQAHVTRVMVHASRLVAATGQREQGARLWAAVFLHDIARRHDGVCHRHGADAARRLRKEPSLRQRLTEAGLTAADYPAIEAAITAHCSPKEVTRDHEHWPLIALLKDADALDRVRLGDLAILNIYGIQSR